MKKMFFLWIAMALVACSPQARLNRLVSHHPELITTRTETKTDTVIHEGIRIDTAWSLISWHDTVTHEVVRNQVVIRLQKIHDTIRLSAATAPDTIRIVKNSVTNAVTATKGTGINWWKWVFVGLVAFILIAATRSVILKN